MADDPIIETGGFRKDGKRYVDNNVREDGSYIVGRGRPPVESKFKTGDGRTRGRRPKGTVNLSTDWQEELTEKITINENGKPKRISKQRATVKQTVARAIKGNDKAAEIVLRHAGHERPIKPGLALSDSALIARWLEQRAAPPIGDHLETDPFQPDANDC